MTVDATSQELKDMLGRYEKDAFMSEMAALLTYIGDGPIPFQPFHKLHSPLRQIFYMAALNLSSTNEERELYDVKNNDEQLEAWNDIIKIQFQLDEMYQDIYIQEQHLDDPIELAKVRVAYPSFIDYYYTGPINFEEQVIERIQRYFVNFNAEIETEFGLNINDFINIYNILDEEMHRLLNRVFELLEVEECRVFWEEMGETNDNPNTWELTDNADVKQLITLMKNQSEKLKVMPSDLYQYYDQAKIDRFINLLCCNDKISADFLLQTQENTLLKHPLYRLNDGRILVLHIKQIIHAVFAILFDFCIRNEQSAQRFYKKRGIELEIKIEEVFRRFFGKEALIFRNYKTRLGKGQDVLVFYKGLVLIIEAKASKKVEPNLNINAAFNQLKTNFKEIFQKGFEQTDRVEELFELDEEVEIFNKDMHPIFKIRSKKIHHVFSIIVTLEKFSQIQTDLSLMLKKEDDIPYPYAICIDDLETHLITMKKERCALHDLVNFLEQRISFYGRLDCKDELELCGHFFFHKKLELPPGNDPIIVNGGDGADIYDEYYEKGLGLANEKNIDRKRSGKFRTWPNSKDVLKRHRERGV